VIHKVAAQKINQGLSLASRIIRSGFSALSGVTMILMAPSFDKTLYFYEFGVFCLLITVACVTQGRVRQFIGSTIGTVLSCAALGYLYVEMRSGTFISNSRSSPSLPNAIGFLVAFGVPGALYALKTRFGFAKSSADISEEASAARATEGRLPPYRRNPWGILVVVVAGSIGFVNLARATSPWLVLVPLTLIVYGFLKQELVRTLSLNRKGYFTGRRYREHWIYEERRGFEIAALMLPVANTGPGHYEMFIPKDAAWRATVPDWARERREEIALRIAERWRQKDFHLPSDWSKR
jgi:hypothetical protein